tara:strand:+ start:22 stop:321 length:300 start_codon:yes stop_codon:yes gene_type:complete
MDYSEERQQHIEDTIYLMWSDSMYVMLEDLECDYELALVENSLRDSVYFDRLGVLFSTDNALGVWEGDADYWSSLDDMKGMTKLTRAQALYIATGDVSI